MEKLELLFKDKKNLIIVSAIYFIVVIVMLFIIWKPESVKDVAKYTEYNEEKKNKEMLEYYLNIIEYLKQSDDMELLSNFFDTNYLDYANITLDYAIDKLKNINNNYNVSNFEVYKYGDNVVYSVVLPFGNDKIDLNIIEKELPYNFSIAYGSYVDSSNTTAYGLLKGSAIKVVNTYHDLNYLEYTLEITNEEYTKLTLNFLNSNNVYLEYGDNEKVYIDMVHSEKGKLEIEPDQTKRFKLRFNMPIQEQVNIKSISIGSVENNGKTYSSTIKF